MSIRSLMTLCLIVGMCGLLHTQKTYAKDDTANMPVHVITSAVLTTGLYYGLSRLFGTEHKTFSFIFAATAVQIAGVYYEAAGDGRCSDHHLATAMGYNALGSIMAVIPISIFGN